MATKTTVGKHSKLCFISLFKSGSVDVYIEENSLYLKLEFRLLFPHRQWFCISVGWPASQVVFLQDTFKPLDGIWHVSKFP